MAKLDSMEIIRLEALKLSVQSAGGLTEGQIFKRADAFADFISTGLRVKTEIKLNIAHADEAIPEGADLGGIEPGEEI